MNVGKRLKGSMALRALVAIIVLGGMALGAVSSLTSGATGTLSPSSNVQSIPRNQAVGQISLPAGAAPYGPEEPGTQVIQTSQLTTTATATYASQSNGTSGEAGSPPQGGGLIEFSSQVTLESASPEQTAASLAALAYTVGGYVAYQSTAPSSADVVIRVPAADYSSALTQVEAMGTMLSLTSNSNDVHVQYTDLNATLASLRTEANSLLRLLNQSKAINSTLTIESQIQTVDQQMDEVESQILQTKTLIDYATISVDVSETPQSVPLSMTLTVAPKSGIVPLSVTFSAVVKGGDQPYVVDYDFGDGTNAQGQVVIHTFTQPGQYNVTVSVTDQEGNTTHAWAVVKVEAQQGQSGLGSFLGTVGTLFVGVVEGIVEVAAVVLPIAAVGALVLLPFRHRKPKDVTQNQQQPP